MRDETKDAPCFLSDDKPAVKMRTSDQQTDELFHILKFFNELHFITKLQFINVIMLMGSGQRIDYRT